MDQTLLPIQGPPGTGKTHVTARVILALVKAGPRVAVASNSQEAIRNVLLGCLRASEEEGGGFPVSFCHKVSGGVDGYARDCPVHRATAHDTLLPAPATGIRGHAFFLAGAARVQG